ncbi:FKBP-type peptidyl-prolyl cis-trans isomerase [Ferrimonas balearica]|uniref:FKBP-type peptidyl-prolyl cis-trans isomerase N-terminal domain-containing protein n=1 Tax=Ferrimonas balearica TaxID=44012 RepID=UPI001C999D6D|nr:FKBP-type peptidyl-prolyl cis-trans isomerase [Ferrimonas balearica]MBY5920644.1 FKBP-type peptidyl-prolyl cis-trans isomerase [Ferrimonas balearica]MBY5996671.1 FKBP-type peptidyl-prolyl cis-trans isomerase [Ferrimonas balearica]
MKRFCKHALAALAVSSALFTLPALAVDLENESYSIGASFGKYLSGQLEGQKELGQEIDLDALMDGLEDALKGDTRLEPEAMLDHLNARAERLNDELKQKQQAEMDAAKAANDAYLAENAQKAGVTITKSGLQYEVLTQGDGEKPSREDVVTVHFKGWTIDGSQFENTYTKGEPAQMSLIHTIPGWEEGVQLMSPGAKYRFVMPSTLAYDIQDPKAAMAPHSALIFEIELLSFEEPKAGNFGHGASMGGGE